MNRLFLAAEEGKNQTEVRAEATFGSPVTGAGQPLLELSPHNFERLLRRSCVAPAGDREQRFLKGLRAGPPGNGEFAGHRGIECLRGNRRKETLRVIVVSFEHGDLEPGD